MSHSCDETNTNTIPYAHIHILKKEAYTVNEQATVN